VRGRTAGRSLEQHAQAVNVVTASVTAASTLAVVEGQVRRRRDSFVKPTPRVSVALNIRKCQAAETLSQEVKK